MRGGYKTPLQAIHLLKKKAVRIIAGTHYLATPPNIFHNLNILGLTVFDLYKLQLAMFMYITIRVVSCRSILILMITFLLKPPSMITLQNLFVGFILFHIKRGLDILILD